MMGMRLLEEKTTTILIIAAISFCVVSCIASYWRLRQFPGPLLGAISKLWVLKCTYQKNLHWEVKKLCDEHGKISKQNLFFFVGAAEGSLLGKKVLSCELVLTSW